MSKGMDEELGERHIAGSDVPDWEPSGAVEGLEIRELWTSENGSSICMLKFREGCGVAEAHRHASNQFMFCLSGKYQYLNDGPTLLPGDFYMNPKGNVHGPTIAVEDSTLIEIYDGPHYFENSSEV